ncbi:DUF397 domain-containing protein [Streptomyces sp. NPDC049954]|uniref:DUF397 domain-containing protein n=1 Tax=Streptomyces sp. NPDC049954 TaxID=3155779 RepID=UPI00342CBC8D
MNRRTFTQARTTPNWFKSSYSSADSYCVEVADFGPRLAVRDSKVTDSPRLSFSPASWDRFARTVGG